MTEILVREIRKANVRVGVGRYNEARAWYDEPLKIVRGWRQYLYDETGRAYLDCYSSVPLVGHSHPRVVEASSAF